MLWRRAPAFATSLFPLETPRRKKLLKGPQIITRSEIQKGLEPFSFACQHYISAFVQNVGICDGIYKVGGTPTPPAADETVEVLEANVAAYLAAVSHLGVGSTSFGSGIDN